MTDLLGITPARQAAITRLVEALRPGAVAYDNKSGGSDHPMTLLKRAGVDLSKPETVRAVIDQLDTLVTRLEREIAWLHD